MALDLYGELQQAGMNRIPELLQIDAADSLAALGNRPMAEQVWKRVLASARPKSVEAAIARARLDARTGRAELESWETKLVAAAWGGEILRRVRWSLKAISGS